MTNRTIGRRRGATFAALAGAAALAAGCGSASSVSAPPHGHAASADVPVAPVRAAASPASANWPTFDRTEGRSGVSVSTPAPGKVVRGWTAKLDGDVYTQPLVVGSNVYVATENDTVYDLASETGKVVWSRHLASPVTGGLPCGNINPSGITGTPAIDTGTGVLYAVTFTAAPSLHHTLWAISIASGRVLHSRTIDVPGSDPAAQQERSALSILGSRVYVPYGGLDGDCSDYKGRVAGADLSGLGGLVTFTTPNQREAGIWTPAGAVAHDGSLYVATGNGTPVNAVDDSDSVLRLSPTLVQLQRFTPSNFEQLSANDLDLDTTSPALLPGNLIFMAGKQGVAYLLDASDLGGTGGQRASTQLCSGAFGGDAVDGDTVVVSCYNGLYTAVAHPGSRPALSTGWSAQGIQPGPPIIAGGIVWDVDRGSSTLRGYELRNGHQVYSAPLSSVATSFPTLSASKERLFVPEGSAVVSFRGV